MKKMLLDHMTSTLKFSYPVTPNITLIGYENLNVKEVEVDCTFLYTGESYVEYKLRIDGLDSIALPAHLFEDNVRSNANRIPFELLEQQIRVRVQEGVTNHETLDAATNRLHTVCAYAITPEVAGRDDVRIVVHCKWSGGNEYHYRIDLYAAGVDLGGLSTTDVTRSSQTLLNLCEKSELFAETMLEVSDFETILEKLCTCKSA